MSIIYSMKAEIKEPHGRETYIADFGNGPHLLIYLMVSHFCLEIPVF